MHAGLELTDFLPYCVGYLLGVHLDIISATLFSLSRIHSLHLQQQTKTRAHHMKTECI